LFGDGADVADGFFVVGFELHGLCYGILIRPHDDAMCTVRMSIPSGAFVSRLSCELVP
jgi:hypothetical protein